jgi:hypothetical protein
VTFLLVPLIGENILGILLKSNTKYLPFTGLQSIGQPAAGVSSAHEALVMLAYVAVGLLVSAVLFVRRDAN